MIKKSRIQIVKMISLQKVRENCRINDLFSTFIQRRVLCNGIACMLGGESALHPPNYCLVKLVDSLFSYFFFFSFFFPDFLVSKLFESMQCQHGWHNQAKIMKFFQVYAIQTKMIMVKVGGNLIAFTWDQILFDP